MNRMYQPNWKPRHRMIIFPIIAMVLLASFIVQALWNWLLPHLFNLPRIRYWEATGLLVLSRILFGGFHFRKPSSPSHLSGFKEKFMQMSEEERQQLKDHWKNRCRRPDEK